MATWRKQRRILPGDAGVECWEVWLRTENETGISQTRIASLMNEASADLVLAGHDAAEALQIAVEARALLGDFAREAHRKQFPHVKPSSREEQADALLARFDAALARIAERVRP